MPISVLVCFGIALLAVFILPYISRQRRKKRLMGRPRKPFNEWYDEFYGSSGPDKELVRYVHKAFAKELGIDESMIYPGDRFDRELACPEWWGSRGHELENVEYLIEEFVNKRGKKIPKDAFGQCFTVKELINSIDCLICK